MLWVHLSVWLRYSDRVSLTAFHSRPVTNPSAATASSKIEACTIAAIDSAVACDTSTNTLTVLCPCIYHWLECTTAAATADYVDDAFVIFRLYHCVSS